MSWLNKIFNKGKTVESKMIPREKAMLLKLESSIKNCKAEISKAENESDQLRNWAIEAIRDCFEVPHQLWYEELNKYNEIKTHDSE